MSERGGGLSVIRSATSGTSHVPVAVPGMPRPPSGPFSFGLHDLISAPDFATSHWIYFTYNEPAPRPAGDPAPRRSTTSPGSR